jgi:hypothetical protein
MPWQQGLVVSSLLTEIVCSSWIVRSNLARVIVGWKIQQETYPILTFILGSQVHTYIPPLQIVKTASI